MGRATKSLKLRLPVTDQFLSYILTGCIESPFGSHFLWSHIKRNPEGLVVRASLRYDDADVGEGTHPHRMRIRLIEVRRGLGFILSHPMVNAEITGNILLGTLENDSSNIDQVAADAIIQAAVYGKVVFG